MRIDIREPFPLEPRKTLTRRRNKARCNLLSSLFALIIGGASALPGYALDIVPNYIQPGNRIPGTRSLSGTAPSTSVGSGNIQDIFESAAQYWEERIDDPWEITVNYGWAPLAGFGAFTGIHTTIGLDARTGRIAQSSIRFKNTNDSSWFLDSTPSDNSEYDPINEIHADLGGGTFNTGKYFYAASTPPFIPPNGANPDLLSNAIHELGHALNIYDTTLNALDSNSDGKVEFKNGPVAGTEIPWFPRGGGHPELTPPDGALIMTGIFISPFAHRGLPSEADVVLAAEVSNFKRVNLDDLTYVDQPDFADIDNLTLNGDAQQVGDRLRLTPDESSKAGSAFLTLPFDFDAKTGFETFFEFEIGGANGSGPNGSDGLAFVLHTDPSGPFALGSSGEGLGVGVNATSGSTQKISPSIAIEFDSHQNAFDPSDNHVALIIDGEMARHGALESPVVDLNSGDPVFAWIDYNPISRLFDIFVSDIDTKPALPLFSDAIDLYGLLDSDVFFGFTAGTGQGFNTHDILQWELVVQRGVVEPATATLAAVFLFGLSFAGHRRAH